MLGASKRKHYKFFETNNRIRTKEGRSALRSFMRSMGDFRMYYVYILRSVKFLNQIYTGSTPDLRKRLKSHNEGSSKHTSKFRPWKVIWYGAFSSREKAEKFEKYLKTASGIAFKRKRLV